MGSFVPLYENFSTRVAHSTRVTHAEPPRFLQVPQPLLPGTLPADMLGALLAVSQASGSSLSVKVRSVKSHWPCWAEDAASRGVLSPQVQSLITRPLDPDPGIHLANTDTGNSVAAPIRMVAGRILSRRLYETYLAQGLFTDDNA